MRIHDLEVDRIGSNIKDSKAHWMILMIEIYLRLNPVKHEAIIWKVGSTVRFKPALSNLVPLFMEFHLNGKDPRTP
jgi:hypothetical protein